MSFLISACIIGTALLLDFIVGEPRRYHPLVGFGNIAAQIERKLNPSHLTTKQEACENLKFGSETGYSNGIFAWLLLVFPITLMSYLVLELLNNILILEIVILYLCIGWKSLTEHGHNIQSALKDNDITLARQRVQMIVSRDTNHLNEQQVSQSAIESMLENGNDAIFGCIFWFVVAGAPGAILYRMANTLDAMWGYRTNRFNQFGWASAKLDDLLNFIPARLCALSYALLGNTQRALYCWKFQAHLLSSPNGGPVMTSGAGSLQITLGGPTYYHGKLINKPCFGEDRLPSHRDIQRSIQLVNKTVYLWFTAIVSLGIGIAAGQVI